MELHCESADCSGPALWSLMVGIAGGQVSIRSAANERALLAGGLCNGSAGIFGPVVFGARMSQNPTGCARCKIPPRRRRRMRELGNIIGLFALCILGLGYIWQMMRSIYCRRALLGSVTSNNALQATCETHAPERRR